MRYRIQSKAKVIQDLRDSFSKASIDSSISIILALNKQKISIRDLIYGTRGLRSEKPLLFSSLKKNLSDFIARLLADVNIHGLNELGSALANDFIGEASLYNFHKKIFSILQEEGTPAFSLGDYVYFALNDKTIFEEDRSIIVQSAINISNKISIAANILDVMARRSILDSDVNPFLSAINRNGLINSFFSTVVWRICDSTLDENQENLLLRICKAVIDESVLFDSIQPLPVIFYITRNSVLRRKGKECLRKIPEKLTGEKIKIIEREIERIKDLE